MSERNDNYLNSCHFYNFAYLFGKQLLFASLVCCMPHLAGPLHSRCRFKDRFVCCPKYVLSLYNNLRLFFFWHQLSANGVGKFCFCCHFTVILRVCVYVCVCRQHNSENFFMAEMDLVQETAFQNFFFKVGNLLKYHSWLIKHIYEIMHLIFPGIQYTI